MRKNTDIVGGIESLLHTMPSGVVDQINTTKKYDTFTGIIAFLDLADKRSEEND
jgi:hypothetical protein